MEIKHENNNKLNWNFQGPFTAELFQLQHVWPMDDFQRSAHLLPLVRPHFLLFFLLFGLTTFSVPWWPHDVKCLVSFALLRDLYQISEFLEIVAKLPPAYMNKQNKKITTWKYKTLTAPEFERITIQLNLTTIVRALLGGGERCFITAFLITQLLLNVQVQRGIRVPVEVTLKYIYFSKYVLKYDAIAF